MLQQHPWPGNIRQLRNVVCRALLVRRGPRIDASGLCFDEDLLRAPEDTAEPALELPEGVTLEQMMQRLERQLIESTLRRCRYNKDRAARALGLARSSLFKRLKEWGLGQSEE
jgi:DNA-binding NtrC family response regulator